MNPLEPALASLEKVLQFYERQNTPLNHTPTMEYQDRACPTHPGVIGQIPGEEKFSEAVLEYFGQQFGKLVWRDAYGINVSDAAIEQAIRISKKATLRSIAETNNSGAEIILYQPYTTIMSDSAKSNELIAHEVWHLIEKQHDVLSKQPFIIEGTATYAMKRYSGVVYTKLLEKQPDFESMTYLGCAQIVQQHAQNSHNPYRTILDKEFREQVQQEFSQRMMPLIVRGLYVTLEDEELQKSAARNIMQIPQFRALKGNLTAETYITAYEQLGAVILAAELREQDLGKALAVMRKIGF